MAGHSLPAGSLAQEKSGLWKDLVLNEPAFLDELVRAQPSPDAWPWKAFQRDSWYRWSSQRTIQRTATCRFQHPNSRMKETPREENVPSLTYHFNPLLKHLLMFLCCLSLSCILSFLGNASWGSDICLLSYDTNDLRQGWHICFIGLPVQIDV